MGILRSTVFSGILALAGNGPSWSQAACPQPPAEDFSRDTLWNIPSGFEPMELAVLPNEEVLVISRLGKIVAVGPAAGQIREPAQLSLSSPGTKGLLGIALSPNFSQDRWVYLFYSPSAPGPAFRLSRFKYDGTSFLFEKPILEIPGEHLDRDHTGGSIAFDAGGNLFLSTGDNSLPGQSSGYAPLDQRIERITNDAERSSANTNDLRGKILRLKPMPFPDSETPVPGMGSTYTIPKGNLKEFHAGLWPGAEADKVRPEIYTMGHRNPFRIAVHPRKGWLHWGEVGPDAFESSETRGPLGHEEFNVARGPGNYGWPHFAGFNIPYARHNFATNQSGDFFQANAPENTSIRNTGVRILPPALTPVIAVDKKRKITTSRGNLAEDWGTGSAAMGGGFFDATVADPERSPERLPPYYHDKLFIAEFTHRWIRVVTLDDTAGFVSAERFLPGENFTRIIDLNFGGDGRLYVLEWGSNYQPSDGAAKLTRIGFQGNRPDNEACGVVSLASPPDARNGSYLGSPRLIRLEAGRRLSVPAGAVGVSVYSLRGERVFSDKWEAENSPWEITVPGIKGRGTLGWAAFRFGPTR